MSAATKLEPVIVLLIVTSVTTVGILSIWAALSPRHWFLRTAVFLAALAPLAFVPAYEPFIAFVVQGAVVACGVTFWRWRQNRRLPSPEEESTNTQSSAGLFRFSVSTLLLLMPLAAVGTMVAVRLPVLNFKAWGSVAAIGVASGLVTLAAAFMLSVRRPFIVWPIGLFVCFAAGYGLTQIDWFISSLIFDVGWPPTKPMPAPFTYSAYVIDQKTTKFVWPITLPSTAILLGIVFFLASFAINRKRRIFRTMAALAIVLVAAFPLFVLWQLHHPLPVTQVNMPHPNGYDDLVAAGVIIGSGSPMLNTVTEPRSTAELAAEVKKFAPAFDRIQVALSRPCVAPVWPIDPKAPVTSFNFIPNVQNIRTVARAMERKADLARQQGRYDDAARTSVDILRVGMASANGGLIVQYLVGIAVEGIGQWSLYPCVAHLDAKSCHVAIASLEQLDKKCESVDKITYRDRAYEENARGWHGHLQVILWESADANYQTHRAVDTATNRYRTGLRLLLIELALQQYQLNNYHTYPDRLVDLVPKYIANVPIDPFDPRQQPLRYKQTGDGYLLYSVGYDGKDDGGKASTQESGWMDDGDIRLDYLFASLEGRQSDDNTDGDDTTPVPEKPVAPPSIAEPADRP